MKKITGLLIFQVCALIISGCGSPEGDELSSALVKKASAVENVREDSAKYSGGELRSDWRYVLRESGSGPVVVVFPGAETGVSDEENGLYGSVLDGIGSRPCSVAFFAYNRPSDALQWVLEQSSRRGVGAHVAVLGYSYGGNAAGGLVRNILARDRKVTVDLLVTVDAVKSGLISVATSTTASIITLDQSIPGYKNSFASYTGTQKPDGKRFLRHVNYYQNNSKFLRGSAIMQASENYHVQFTDHSIVKHGNIDNIVRALVASDLRTCFPEGAK